MATPATEARPQLAVLLEEALGRDGGPEAGSHPVVRAHRLEGPDRADVDREVDGRYAEALREASEDRRVPGVAEGGHERGVVGPRLGEADPSAGVGGVGRALPRGAGDVAELVAIAHRDEAWRVGGVADLVGRGVAGKARVGEVRCLGVQDGERRLGGGDQSLALAQARRQIVHEATDPLGRDRDPGRALDRGSQVVDGQRSGVTVGIGDLGAEGLHDQRGDVATVRASLDPPTGVDPCIVRAASERDDRGVDVEARRHVGGQ